MLKQMKRLQILIDEELDAALDKASAKTGRSKGALVREAVRRFPALARTRVAVSR